MADFSCAVPDWRERIAACRSLIPDLPLFEPNASRAVEIFNSLHLPDVPGRPLLRDAAGEWQRDLVRAIFGSFDEKENKREIREFFCMVPKKSSKTTGGAAIMLTALLMNKLSDSSYDYGWIDVSTVPAGGATGQVLAKSTNTDFDYGWTSNGLIPTGGTDGQILKKLGSADYSAQWANLTIPLVSVTVAASTSYTTIDPTAGDIFIVSPISSDTTISVSGYVSKPIWLVFVGGSTSRTITFSGTSFRSQGTLAVTGSAMLYTVAFIPYAGSYKYLEVLRTTAV